MVRFLLLIAVLCFGGCGEGKPCVPKGGIDGQVKAATARIAANEGRYVDESSLPEKFKASEFPRIIIDDVRLWLDPKMPGWEEGGGGYRTEQFNCPVAWFDFGGDRTLSDGTDFRSDDESLYKEFANVDGDIMVRHREGVIQIMDGGTWRIVRSGDQLRQSAVDSLVRKTANEIYKQGAKLQIGTSDLWVTLGSDAWYFCESPDSVSTSAISFDTESSNVEVLQTANEVQRVGIDEQSDAHAIMLAAVQAEYEEALSQYVAIGDQVREKSRELAALVKLKKLTEENLTNLRKEVDRLTSEQNAADKAKQEPRLGEYSPDPDGVAAYGRDSQEWEKRNRQDVYAPGLVTPTGDR